MGRRAQGLAMRFDFATATEIIFGCGRIAELGGRARALGSHALLVTGARPYSALGARQLLDDAGVAYTGFSVCSEPTTEMAAAGVRLAQQAGVDLVIGFGGGSVIDAAKAIAVLVTQPEELYQYLEIVGQAQPLVKPGLPFIAVPTTAGTGAEVAKNSVLCATADKVKVSLRSPSMLARLALVDPELTLTVPPEVTAATGLDALTQVIEPYVSIARNPLTDALCLQGMQRSARSLRSAYYDGSNLPAREDLAITSLFGGLALANAKLGAVHGLAAPIGGAYVAPHGAICARLLPEVMRANLVAARAAKLQEVVERFDTVAQVLTGDSTSRAERGVTWVQALVDELSVPRLLAHGITRDSIPGIVTLARRASSMKGNPIELLPEVLEDILQNSL
jgi:alcohol dehydrogenase class IV